MWLLSTDRAELEYFLSADEAAEVQYAILSHVWNKTEQSFQETQALRAKCAAEGTNPRDYSSDKVRESCRLAERHGYKWIWNDTCCIDKTSSSELSEAINSMFSYYSLAAICYAYLKDVKAINAKWKWTDSLWFSQGWTLQELIAPNHVLFLAQDWTSISTKADLAMALEDLTYIPVDVLRMTEELSNYSVAERMSWAAKRVTTRKEDEAYCLMGIFDVNMPTLYGEGSKAFRRLQEEIMRHTFDPTLFVWGDSIDMLDSQCAYRPRYGDVSEFTTPPGPDMYLFAPSPAAFKSPAVFKRRSRARAVYDPNILSNIFDESLEAADTASPSLLRKPQTDNVPAFTITPHGVRARLPVIHMKNGVAFVALLVRYESLYRYHGKFAEYSNPVLLVLSRSRDSVAPLYHTSALRQLLTSTSSSRVVVEGDGGTLKKWLKSLGEESAFVWRDIYLVAAPPRTFIVPYPLRMNFSLTTPFRLPWWNFRQTLEASDCTRRWTLLPSPFPASWNGSPPAKLALEMVSPHKGHIAVLKIYFGRCTAGSSSSGDGRRRLGPHWASFQVDTLATPVDGDSPSSWCDDASPFRHVCATDHIDEWPGREKMFYLDEDRPATGYSYRQMQQEWEPFRGLLTTERIHFVLSFVPCPLSPKTTYVVTLRTHRTRVPIMQV